MEISVIIVNYNVKFFLEQCLYSVKASLENIAAEIIVVDNASPDKSVEYLQSKFPAVKFISNATNKGFGAACNQGFKASGGKCLLFLNPDCIVPEDCFEKCLGFLNNHPVAGAIGVKMLDGSGRFLKESKRALPSLSTSFFKLFGFAALFPNSKLFAKYYLGHLDENKNHEIDVLAGAFMMIKRNVFEMVNGFDENFFMYGEDIDLSFRIKKAGFKNYYFSDTEIIHFKGESTKKGRLDYVRMFYHAMSIFVNKHYKNGLYKLFINLGIGIMAFFSAIANSLAGIFRNAKVKSIKKIAIAGTEQECQSAELLLNQAGSTPASIKRITLNETSLLNGKSHFSELIFCAGTSSYKQIIECIKRLSGDQHASIHKAGSNSIVGSSFKDSRGVTVGLD